MSITSLRRNIAAYAVFMALSVLVGVLTEMHKQIGLGWIEPMELIDAAIVAVLPTLVMALTAMKLPSVGHEAVADKVADHEEQLAVTDTAPPAVPRRAGQVPEVTGRG